MEELFISSEPALLLKGEDDVRISVTQHQVAKLAEIISRQLEDEHRAPSEAVTIHGKRGGTLIVNPVDARRLLSELREMAWQN